MKLPLSRSGRVARRLWTEPDRKTEGGQRLSGVEHSDQPGAVSVTKAIHPDCPRRGEDRAAAPQESVGSAPCGRVAHTVAAHCPVKSATSSGRTAKIPCDPGPRHPRSFSTLSTPLPHLRWPSSNTYVGASGPSRPTHPSDFGGIGLAGARGFEVTSASGQSEGRSTRGPWRAVEVRKAA